MPVRTRNKSRSTVYDSDDSGSDAGSNYSRPSPGHKRSKVRAKTGSVDMSAGKAKKSPEQRAQELKDRYAKRRAEIVADHKRQTDELFKELMDMIKEEHKLREDQQNKDFEEYARLVQVRGDIETDVIARMNQFQLHTKELAMRLEVALAGRVAETSEKLEVSGDEQKSALNDIVRYNVGQH